MYFSEKLFTILGDLYTRRVLWNNTTPPQDSTEVNPVESTQNQSPYSETQQRSQGDTTQSSFNKQDETEWYKSKILQIIGAIFLIASIVIAFYEYARIPSLNDQINDLTRKVEQLESVNAYLQDKSAVAQLTRDNELLNKSLESEKSALTSKNQLIQKLTQSETNLNYQINELKGNIQKWDSVYKELNSRFMRCSTNFGFKREIDNLRQKIEQNNNKINGYGSTEREINTLTIDNQNLNTMIRGYQEKMQCQN